ncbi:MAG: hypothetical protein RTU30_01915 [Candidatus Thorarchaeota archaeon]
MLRFIQILPNVSSKGDFILKDLPGSGQRIDILCRVLAACFDWGPINWSLAELEVRAILSNETTVTFKHTEQIPIGEVGWATVIMDSLRGNPPDFVTVENKGLEKTIKEIHDISDSALWVLDEGGNPLEDEIDLKTGAQNSFMLGDNRGFDSQTQDLVKSYGISTISLGLTPYLSSHCVANVISRLERMVE